MKFKITATLLEFIVHFITIFFKKLKEIGNISGALEHLYY